MRQARSQRSDTTWLSKLEGSEVGDYLLDGYIGKGNIGYVYRAHLKAYPDVVHAVKLVPTLKEGWDTERLCCTNRLDTRRYVRLFQLIDRQAASTM